MSREFSPTPHDERTAEVYNEALGGMEREYKERLLAAYLLGSLAHGGYSPEISDIDVGFVLDGDEITEEDWDTVQGVREHVKESTEYGDKISMFWSTVGVLSERTPSGTYPTSTKQYGVFPPYDMNDLLDHGVLIHGEDVRDRVRRPSEDDLYVGGIELALSYMNTDEKNRGIVDKEAFLELNDHDTSKVILFPARLEYTLLTGEVGNNEGAALSYLENVQEQDREQTKALIDQALRLREGEPKDVGVLRNNFSALRDMYLQMIDGYTEKMDVLRPEYAQQLQEWRSKL